MTKKLVSTFNFFVQHQIIYCAHKSYRELSNLIPTFYIVNTQKPGLKNLSKLTVNDKARTGTVAQYIYFRTLRKNMVMFKFS